jgi:16S rRNA (guanine(966)-N(2))-methyltransferase RsmD
MRVIAGEARGRQLKAVPGHTTRPTTDKVKEALFSMIGPYFEGERVLDLFAGTGALGIEALSRGAGHAVFVDADVRSVQVVRKNLEVTGMSDRAEVYRNDASRAIKALARRGVLFDLVFLDPPYRMDNADQLLLALSASGLVTDGGIGVIEHRASHAYPDRFGSFVLVKHSVYGEAALSIYRHVVPSASAIAPPTTTEGGMTE